MKNGLVFALMVSVVANSLVSDWFRFVIFLKMTSLLSTLIISTSSNQILSITHSLYRFQSNPIHYSSSSAAPFISHSQIYPIRPPPPEVSSFRLTWWRCPSVEHIIPAVVSAAVAVVTAAVAVVTAAVAVVTAAVAVVTGVGGTVDGGWQRR